VWIIRNMFTHIEQFQLGTFVRAKAKVEELTNVIAEQRRH
jgi:hypothetical protein